MSQKFQLPPRSHVVVVDVCVRYVHCPHFPPPTVFLFISFFQLLCLGPSPFNMESPVLSAGIWGAHAFATVVVVAPVPWYLSISFCHLIARFPHQMDALAKCVTYSLPVKVGWREQTSFFFRVSTSVSLIT